MGPPLDDEGSSSDSSSSSSDSESSSSDEEAAAAADSAASKAAARSNAAGGERRRAQRAGGDMPENFKGLTAAELRAIVRSRSTHRARSRLRFAIFKEHLDVDAWYEVRDWAHRACSAFALRACGLLPAAPPVHPTSLFCASQPATDHPSLSMPAAPCVFPDSLLTLAMLPSSHPCPAAPSSAPKALLSAPSSAPKALLSAPSSASKALLSAPSSAAGAAPVPGCAGPRHAVGARQHLWHGQGGTGHAGALLCPAVPCCAALCLCLGMAWSAAASHLHPPATAVEVCPCSQSPIESSHLRRSHTLPQAAGVEDSLAVAHAVLDNFERHGQPLGQGWGCSAALAKPVGSQRRSRAICNHPSGPRKLAGSIRACY